MVLFKQCTLPYLTGGLLSKAAGIDPISWQHVTLFSAQSLCQSWVPTFSWLCMPAIAQLACSCHTMLTLVHTACLLIHMVCPRKESAAYAQIGISDT